MKRRLVVLGTIGFLVVAGVAGALLRARQGGFKAAGDRAAAPSLGAFAPSPTMIGAEPAPAPAPKGATTTGTGPGTLQALGLPQIGQRIVKTATISLSVKKGGFTAAFQQVTTIASSHAGYVASSETETDRLRSGTVVIRVPVDQFELTLSQLRGLGTVRSEQISGQDVTGQVVDLQARLRNWQAQEAVLLNLMAKSTSISDSIKIQQQLQDVQLAIEEIRGQLQALSNQADLSTITLSMAEAGAVPAPRTQSALGKAWHQAADGFVAVIAAVLVGLGYLVPLSLIVLAAALAWVLYRRARPRATVVKA